MFNVPKNTLVSEVSYETFEFVKYVTEYLTEMSTRNISWGVKAAGAYG
jgi:hypothetical protein